jgi:hypothetical protein
VRFGRAHFVYRAQRSASPEQAPQHS